MSTIQISNLTKRYGRTTALDSVSLTFEQGKIYGLLGRNGAGKSTLLNAITNRIFPEGGEVTIHGMPAKENDRAQSLVYMTSESHCYPDAMRVKQVFQWTSRFYGGAFDMAYALKLCDVFKLNPSKRIKHLSTGYASIYKVITALSLDVPFLLLDEPVLGLDANHREMLYKIILENYAEHPRTLVVSTHLIEEVSTLIEEVIIIKDGRIIKQAPCEELLDAGYALSGPAEAVDQHCIGKHVIGIDVLGGLKIAYIMGRQPQEQLSPQLAVSKMDLQKLFIQLTNQ